MRWSALLLIVVLLLPAWRVMAEVWQIACDENFPPYNFIEDGKVVGLDAEIITAIVQAAGATPDFEPHPWSRVQQLLERDEIDAAFQFVGRPDRFEKYFMVGPHRTGQTVFAARPNLNIVWQNLQDLQPWRIGMIRGYTYDAAFDTAPYLNKDATAGDNRQLVRMLAAGRVDLIIGDREALTHFARRDGLDLRLDILAKPLAEVPRYIAVPKSRPEVARRLEAGLAQIRRDGSLAAILRRWE